MTIYPYTEAQLVNFARQIVERLKAQRNDKTGLVGISRSDLEILAQTVDLAELHDDALA